jgi:hypothetical protein
MENNNKIELRRSFLKKAAYAVPAVVALGQITHPSSAEAFKKDSASTVKLNKEPKEKK